jgi:hypothetical protein
VTAEDAAPAAGGCCLVGLTIAACVWLNSWYAVSVHVHAQGKRAQLLATHHFLEGPDGAPRYVRWARGRARHFTTMTTGGMCTGVSPLVDTFAPNLGSCERSGLTGDALKGAGHATGDGGNGRPGGDHSALSPEFLIQWSRQHEQLRTLARFSLCVDALQVRHTDHAPSSCSPCIQHIFVGMSALSSA